MSESGVCSCWKITVTNNASILGSSYPIFNYVNCPVKSQGQ